MSDEFIRIGKTLVRLDDVIVIHLAADNTSPDCAFLEFTFRNTTRLVLHVLNDGLGLFNRISNRLVGKLDAPLPNVETGDAQYSSVPTTTFTSEPST